ncbi:MAG: hypothetical protein U9O53_02080 [archaeon]|nr:hypothetical protein [archaeon]
MAKKFIKFRILIGYRHNIPVFDISPPEGELNMHDLISLIRSEYIHLFQRHYNTDANAKISSVFAGGGIPLMFSNKTRYEELSESIKDGINSLSCVLSGNHEDNGRKWICLGDYKKNIDCGALEKFLRTFNLKRPSNILGIYESFNSIMFDCLDSAFYDCSDNLNSEKRMREQKP